MPQIFSLKFLILASAVFAIMALALFPAWAGPVRMAIHEPASLFLLGSGLAGSAGVLRRRHRNRKQNQQET